MSEEPTFLPYDPFPSFPDFASSVKKPASFDGIESAFNDLRKTASVGDLAAAVMVATKWAAVDTGAIEGLYEVERGFTFSVALSGAAWDNIHLLKGEQAARTIEDQMTGYEHVLDIATKSRPVTEAWIRDLHTTICASQDTFEVLTAVGPQSRELPKGKYKSDPNSPLNFASNEVHSYASPMDTPPEMERFVTELHTDEFARAHPTIQAAYAHYAFVCIHPFPDGNGRVSRALSSVFLYRRPGVPLVIFADQKPAYIDALESADAGDYQAWFAP
jgi:Fic family protein